MFHLCDRRRSFETQSLAAPGRRSPVLGFIPAICMAPAKDMPKDCQTRTTPSVRYVACSMCKVT